MKSSLIRRACAAALVLATTMTPAVAAQPDHAVARSGIGVHSVDVTGTHPFLRPDGSVYPPPGTGDGKAVDPEEVRVDPSSCQYWWAQEGDRPKSSSEPVIQPSIQLTSRSGAHRGQLPLPPDYEITLADRGPRRNNAVEAITFGAGNRVLTSAAEGPLLQDGPEPDLQHGAP
ncbi:esterase-like activity of phytase family protein [Streptomyces sp. NPDC020362]|uniref:esterase-like activity of phytase family protein n=1 Tax=unclassified Streptomyces TaxID=2593676 RepID=UPI0033EE6E59